MRFQITERAFHNADGLEGYAESVAVGTVQITALYTPESEDPPLEAVANLTVANISGKPIRVEVIPQDSSISVNQTQQFQLFGYWPNPAGGEHQQDLTFEPQTTWKSSDSKTASISNSSNKGLATGISAGTSDIEGSYRAVKDSTVLTVTDP